MSAETELVQALREENERLRRRVEEIEHNYGLLERLLEALPDGIGMADTTGTILYTNAALRARLTPHTAIRETLIHDTQQTTTDTLTDLIRNVSGDGNWTGVLTHTRQDGSTFDEQVMAFDIEDNTQQPYAVGVLVRDVSNILQLDANLRRTQAILRALIEHAPAGIYIKDADGRYIIANQRWLSAAHLEARQVLGKRERDFLPTDLLAREMKEEEYVIRTGNALITEHPALLSDTSSVTYLTCKFPVPTIAEGNTVTAGIWFDISERKRMEEELRHYKDELERRVEQQTAELRRAHQELFFHVENSPLAVIEWDHNHRLRRWSSQAEDFFGWTAEEVLGKTWEEFDLDYHEDRDMVLLVAQELLDGTLPRAVNRNRNITKDGSVIWCEWYNSVLRNEAGQIVSVLSLVQNVTNEVEARLALEEWSYTLGERVHERTAELEDEIEERRRTESALRESESLYRLLSENSRDMICLHDSAGIYIFVSNAVTDLLGYTPIELIGRSPYELFSKKILSASGGSPTSLRCRGAWTMLLNTVSAAKMAPTPGLKPRPALYTIVMATWPICRPLPRDVSQRKRTEAELQARTRELSLLNAELARANRMKDEFLANMSHELRTPLNAILGISEAMREMIYGPLSERQSELLATVHSSGKHLLGLINEILDLAKSVQAGAIWNWPRYR
ncbi:MAG: PAS domain S-box protein [Blastochloris sp.]|nr:PAS domain S-box protein [Blastochloris sp.]